MRLRAYNKLQAIRPGAPITPNLVVSRSGYSAKMNRQIITYVVYVVACVVASILQTLHGYVYHLPFLDVLLVYSVFYGMCFFENEENPLRSLSRGSVFVLPIAAIPGAQLLVRAVHRRDSYLAFVGVVFVVVQLTVVVWGGFKVLSRVTKRYCAADVDG